VAEDFIVGRKVQEAAAARFAALQAEVENFGHLKTSATYASWFMM